MDISTITKSVKHEFTFKLDSRLIASVYGKYNLLSWIFFQLELSRAKIFSDFAS